jgi:hypothetical protein
MESTIQTDTLMGRLSAMVSAKKKKEYGENLLQEQMFSRVVSLVEDKSFLEETVCDSTEGGHNVHDAVSDVYTYIKFDRPKLLDKIIISDLEDSLDEYTSYSVELHEQDGFHLKQLIDIRNIIFA